MPPTKPPPAPQNAVHAKLAKNIGEFGWAALSVFPTGAEPIDPFTYTVGFWRSYDHPELIITGMAGETSHGILGIFAAAIAEGKSFEAGRYPDALPGRERNYDAVFRELAPDKRDEYLRGARRWNAYEDFPALQLIYPDPLGVFPWEEGYDQNFVQPLLGDPDA